MMAASLIIRKFMVYQRKVNNSSQPSILDSKMTKALVVCQTADLLNFLEVQKLCKHMKNHHVRLLLHIDLYILTLELVRLGERTICL